MSAAAGVKRILGRRLYSTQPELFASPPPSRFLPPISQRPKPSSTSFFTGSESFYDNIENLEATQAAARRTLQSHSVLPLPASISSQVPVVPTAFRKAEDMAGIVKLAKLRPSQYRRILDILEGLNKLRSVARIFGQREVDEHLTQVLGLFERTDKADIMNVLQPNGEVAASVRVKRDEFGRTYALGKRKESSARVWIIPVRGSLGEEGAKKQSDLWSKPDGDSYFTPTSSVLINNMPLHDYFPNVVDRERVTRPLKLSGALGAYNVFALVRGGGTTGQAGAVMHGLAKALAAQAPEMSKILRKGE